MIGCPARNHPNFAYFGNVRQLKLLEPHLPLLFPDSSNKSIRNCTRLFEYLFHHEMFVTAFFSHHPCPTYSLHGSHNLFPLKVHKRELIILEDSHIAIFQKNETVCPVEDSRSITCNKVFSIPNTNDQRAFFFRSHHDTIFFIDNANGKRPLKLCKGLPNGINESHRFPHKRAYQMGDYLCISI